jgi:DNA-binding NarL/FixJ family response regulator
MSPKPLWTTLIVEDQSLFRSLLARLLKEDSRFSLIGEAKSGEEGWERCLEQPPHLLLLDIQLPGMDGIELAQKIRRRFPETRILALTTLTDSHTINRVIDAGLHGYIEKDRELDELERALTQVAAGGSYTSKRLSEVRRAVSRDPEAYPKILSPREQEIVGLVAQGLKSAAIATKLGLGLRTVQNHRYRIMQKLDLHDTASLVRYALDQGIVSPPS